MKAINKERGFEFKGACASSAQGVDVQVMRSLGWDGRVSCSPRMPASRAGLSEKHEGRAQLQSMKLDLPREPNTP